MNGAQLQLAVVQGQLGHGQPICHFAHITLRFFVIVRDMALSSGPKIVDRPVKSRASSRTWSESLDVD